MSEDRVGEGRVGEGRVSEGRVGKGWAKRANELAAESLATGDAIGWFDRLYEAGRRGEVDLPWDPGSGHPLLAGWAREGAVDGRGRRAVVVGCGLGHDAEFVASLGFAVTAFDVSPAAITTARERRPDSPVRYVVADLFDLPDDWRGAFDLVVEVYIVQALPPAVREDVIRVVTGLVAESGTLVAVSDARDADEPVSGPPWPLTPEDMALFGAGLETVRLDRLGDHWLAELHRR
jgi:SAM-dependent methyltransferase